MPLPPALAARLAKRGLTTAEKAKQDVVEEVFAEDYDDMPLPPGTEHMDTEVQKHVQHQTVIAEPTETDRLVYEASACPNKPNAFHECGDFCKERWGLKIFVPDTVMDRKRQRMLRKYPLLNGWEEVGDPNTGRYYYWNTVTDEVSWLAPTHPKAYITMPEEKLLKDIIAGMEAGSEHSSKEEAEEDDEAEEEEMDDLDEEEEHDFEEIEREIELERREKSRKQSERDRDVSRPDKEKKDKRGRRREDKLDPMDPAAYSDIPRGTWSTGLDKPGSAKTGVDQTASGPLYQQRPYPAPGAVLRMNREMQDS